MASILAGFDTPEHVDSAVAYETATEEEKDYASVLAKASCPSPITASAPTAGTAPPCPKGIDIAMVNKLCDLAKMQPEVPAASGLTMKGCLPMEATAFPVKAVRRDARLACRCLKRCGRLTGCLRELGGSVYAGIDGGKTGRDL